jgi:hypothetical protein
MIAAISARNKRTDILQIPCIDLIYHHILCAAESKPSRASDSVLI